jgi:hypothetical protein
VKTWLPLAAVGAALLTGCATAVSFEGARQRVLLRASFEFTCPPDRLNVQELASDEGGPIYLGVSGCSRRAVYVRVLTPTGAVWLNDTVPPTDDKTRVEAPPL